jgi:hypothetical protein
VVANNKLRTAAVLALRNMRRNENNVKNKLSEADNKGIGWIGLASAVDS